MKTLLALLTVVVSFAFASEAEAGWRHRRHVAYYGYPAYYAPAPVVYVSPPVVTYYRPVVTYYRPVTACYPPVVVAPPVVTYRQVYYPAYSIAPAPYYYGW